MKPYFETDNLVQLLSIPISAGIALAILLVGILKLIPSRKAVKYIGISFLFLSFILFIDYCFGIVPFLPDSNEYNHIIRNTSFIDTNMETSQGVKNYGILIYPFKFLSFFFTPNFVIFQFVFYLLGITFIWKAWMFYQQEKVLDARFFLICVCLPSVLLYIVSPLREALNIFGFGFFLYSLFHPSKSIWRLLLGTIVGALLRPQLIVFFIFAIFITKAHKLSLVRTIGILAIAIGSFFGLAQWLFPRYLSLLSIKGIVSFRNYQYNYFSGFSDQAYGNVDWANYMDALQGVFLLNLQFILAPLPIVSNLNPFRFVIPLADVAFILLFLGTILFSIRKVWRKDHIWFLLIIGFIGMFGIFEFFLSGAVRHRLPVTLMLVPLFLKYFPKFRLNNQGLK